MVLPAAGANPGQAHVLVVEDEVLIRVALAEELRQAGYHVVEAATAEGALSYLETGSRVDLVFADIQLAGPSSGVDLAEHLAGRAAAPPVLLTSALPDGSLAGRGFRFVPKPYRLEAVVALIAEILAPILAQQQR